MSVHLTLSPVMKTDITASLTTPPLGAILCQKHFKVVQFLHLMVLLSFQHANQMIAWQHTCAEHERCSQRMSSWS